jgi:hypothetical protein
MPTDIPLTAPGDHYRGQWLDFLPDLLNHFTNRTPYELVRVFSLLPLAPKDEDVYANIAARGSATIEAARVFNEVEDGDFDADFMDARFGLVRVSFPVRLEATWVKIARGTGLKLDFSAHPLNIWIEHLPNGIGVSKSLSLQMIQFKTDKCEFRLKDRNSPFNVLVLTVDFGSSYFLTSGKVRQLGESLSAELMCNGGGSGEGGYWVKWGTSGCGVYAERGLLKCLAGPFDTVEDGEAWIEAHCENHACDPDAYECPPDDDNDGGGDRGLEKRKGGCC